jgi:hypothetical protein
MRRNIETKRYVTHTHSNTCLAMKISLRNGLDGLTVVLKTIVQRGLSAIVVV